MQLRKYNNMSLWTDLLGAEIRYVVTPTYGRIRIAEGGDRIRKLFYFSMALTAI
jgi:hypothetical protein